MFGVGAGDPLRGLLAGENFIRRIQYGSIHETYWFAVLNVRREDLRVANHINLQTTLLSLKRKNFLPSRKRLAAVLLAAGDLTKYAVTAAQGYFAARLAVEAGSA